MNIYNAQKEVDNWIKKYGIRYFDILTNMIRLTEEVGEVAHIIARKYGEISNKESDTNNSLEIELCDTLFVIFCIANQTGINLEKEFYKNLIIKSKRDKYRHKYNKKINKTLI